MSVRQRIACLFMLAALAGCNEPPQQAEPVSLPLVETTEVISHGQDYTIEVNGFVRAPDTVNLVTEVSGIVSDKSERLEVGQYFKQDEELFRLEQTNYQAQVLQAQAELDNARVAEGNAEDNLQRIQTLYQQDTVSQARLDEAQLTQQTAQARVKQARAALQQAEEALQDTVLTAPFDALIATENVSVGAYFSPAQPALTLISAGKVEVEAGLDPEQSVAVSRRISADDTALFHVVSLSTGQKFDAVLLSVSPLLDAASRTISHILLVKDAANAGSDTLTVGEYAQLRFAARAEQPLLRIPAAALRQNNHVYLLDQNNKLQKIAVTPVAYQQEGVLIEEDKRLLNARLLLTSLVNEATGLKVRTTEE